VTSSLLRAWREFSGATPEPYYNGTLRQFASEVHPRFRWYRHIEVLAEQLEAVVSGQQKRLMTFEPPRHGKSLLKSRIFPAYALAKRPDWWLGVCSYEATLAQDFSRTARDNYLRVGGELRDDSTAVNLWQTARGGGLWASGVGGPITGKGFHVGCIDDPLKNAAEADSLVKRTSQKRWYESTFFTRAEPDAAILLTMTRWHEDDLAGWLLSQELDEPERWTIVNLPAIKDGEGLIFPVTCTVVPDWRKAGEALCPERYDAPTLTKKMRVAGPRVAEALYQQRPSPDSGTIFKREWWKFWTTPDRPIPDVPTLPALDFSLQSWDMSFKDTDTSDYVSGQVWGLSGARLYLLDRVNERMSFSAACTAMRTISGKWPKTTGKYVEDAANGPAIINALQRDVLGIVAVKPDGGKVARAYAVQALVQAGNVYLPHPSIAPWVEDFIRQLATFPNGAHDDDVDACTQALNQLAWSAREPAPPKPEASDDRHPGWDLKEKRRNARRDRSLVPDHQDDRAGRYTQPVHWRAPRWDGSSDEMEEG
jgi:predicted phage terminase large subunit-like protein